jgi:hypothetical protein
MFARSSTVRTFAVALIATLLVACSASQAPSPSSASPSAPVVVPSAPPSTDPSPSAPADAGSPDPSIVVPTPSPTPAAPAVWSRPSKPIAGLSSCEWITTVIDGNGTAHLAAACSPIEFSEIRYAVATGPGHWTTATFAPPAERFETAPQLAVDGSTLYLAYTRLARTDGGCGDNGLQDVGVYYRTRSLPSGDWSGPRSLGTTRDELESFRVRDGVIHATVFNDNSNATAYVTSASGGSRVTIGSAVGSTSLRIGDDGAPRIAFEGKGIEYGRISAGAGSFKAIPNSARGWDPVLVLEPGNVADVLWSKSYHGGGCAEPDPLPEDGTYFSTDAGGSWQTVKLSKAVGGTSLTVDPATGGIHAVLSDFDSIVAFDRSPGGTWTHQKVVSGGATSPVIRQSPTTGSLLLAFAVHGENGGVSEVEVMTKG